MLKTPSNVRIEAGTVAAVYEDVHELRWCVIPLLLLRLRAAALALRGGDAGGMRLILICSHLHRPPLQPASIDHNQ